MAKAIEAADPGVDRLGKLLPAEVTGLYVSIRALFTDGASDYAGYWLLIMATASLALALFYIWRVRGVNNPLHLAIYAITFALWAVSLDPGRLSPHLPPFLSAFLAQVTTSISILWSFGFPFLISSQSVASR